MKILSVTPDKQTAFSHYRGHGAMTELHRLDKYLDVESIDGKDYKRGDLKGKQLCFVQRPESSQLANLCIMAKRQNVPLVVDFDDDFFNVDPDGVYHKLKEAQFINYRKYCDASLKIANAVIVSTEYLKRQYSKYNDEIIVIRNCFDDYCENLVDGFNYSKVVLWRGGNSHKKDLEEYQQEIALLIQKNPDFKFVFWTDALPSWIVELSTHVPNIILKGVTHPFEFYQELAGLQPSLTIVPLEDTIFNHSKSDIAKLEATSVGGVCLCPDWEEWNWDGSLKYHYEDGKSFYNNASHILHLIRNKYVEVSHEWIHNLEHLYTQRLLSNANKRRIDLFNQLV